MKKLPFRQFFCFFYDEKRRNGDFSYYIMKKLPFRQFFAFFYDEKCRNGDFSYYIMKKCRFGNFFVFFMMKTAETAFFILTYEKMPFWQFFHFF
jgi:hypothetical protein